MGKGDKKSKKGKRFQHSFGKTRPRKHKSSFVAKPKSEEKPKTVEVKKPIKQETESTLNTAVETKVEEVLIKTPKVSEIIEEIKLPEVTMESVPVITEMVPEPPKEEIKPEVPALKSEKPAEEKTAEEAPKKRGRPKKKKEE